MRLLPSPAACGLLLCLLAACATAPPSCKPGSWVSPSLHPLADPVPNASEPVILLGEQHDRQADHAWELATIERLHAAHPDIVLGFEMFPRSAQPVLDEWWRGKLSEPDFLRLSHWHDVWGFDPKLYLPIFRLARNHRVPMLALNVSRALVHRVSQQGWAALPENSREGIGTPAPLDAAYRASLADAMAGHGGPSMTPARLAHFVDAQSVWDRAMAEAIATQRAREPGRIVVAIMGAGHLENRGGVPHQLAALGQPKVAVWLPTHGSCEPQVGGFADALYED